MLCFTFVQTLDAFLDSEQLHAMPKTYKTLLLSKCCAHNLTIRNTHMSHHQEKKSSLFFEGSMDLFMKIVPAWPFKGHQAAFAAICLSADFSENTQSR